MFERILVPLDGSEFSEAALPFVQKIPSRHVTLTHVVTPAEPPDAELLGIDPMDVEWKQAYEAFVLDYLNDLADRLREPGRDVDVQILPGDAAEGIVVAAGTADLIVMTTQGRSARGRILYGSVADRVARHASVPTLLVRTSADSKVAPQLDRVVVPLDGSELAELALTDASHFGRELKLPLHLVRVVELDAMTARAVEQFTSEALASRLEALERQATYYLDGHVRQLEEVGLTVTREVRIGSAAEALLETIEPGSMVVMTTHGGGGAQRWFIGGVAEKLVRLAPAPVLLVRADRDRTEPASSKHAARATTSVGGG